jgi:MFS family permease
MLVASVSFSVLRGHRAHFETSTQAFVFALCYIPQAVGHSLAQVIVFRGIQGAAASAANSLVGGVVADIFPASTRGFPMTIFAIWIFSGQGLGAVIFGQCFLSYEMHFD